VISKNKFPIHTARSRHATLRHATSRHVTSRPVATRRVPSPRHIAICAVAYILINFKKGHKILIEYISNHFIEVLINLPYKWRRLCPIISFNITSVRDLWLMIINDNIGSSAFLSNLQMFAPISRYGVLWTATLKVRAHLSEPNETNSFHSSTRT
jgi:hypothetical protein